MHSYVDILIRLLDSFMEIRSPEDLYQRFDDGFLTGVDPQQMTGAPDYPIPVDVHLFDYIDKAGNQGSLEVCFKKNTGELVNARVAAFFSDLHSRDDFYTKQVNPFFKANFHPGPFPTYANLPVAEYHKNGLAVGLNRALDLPLLSTYITLEGFQ